MDFNKIFFCKSCGHKSKSVLGHLHHSKVHRNVTNYAYCGLGHCRRTFRTEAALRSHIMRNHKLFSNRQAKSPFRPVPNALATFTCTIETCSKEFFERKNFMAHLRDHMNSGTPILCPFCDRNSLAKYCSMSSFWGHIYKKHRRSENANPSSVPQPPADIYTEEISVSYEEDRQEIISHSRNEFKTALAQFYQKLEYKHMVPASTTQIISGEFSALITDIHRSFLNTVADTLQKEGMPPDQISNIIFACCESNEWMRTNRDLSSIYLRKQFYTKNFQFIEPVAVPLKKGSHFYYVPIEETIKAAFKNKSWNFTCKTPLQSQDNVLRDFTDGDAFKNNVFFQEYPSAIPLILYQDGIELVCPIGPAKNMKHKVEAIYLAFGNLPADVRFKKENIQLVALCCKSDFNVEEVHGYIVDEILRLQEPGIEVENVGNVKAGLAFIAADNLGSHGLAGMCENFSRTTYFCRYCLLKRPLFKKAGGETREFPTRSVDSYERAVAKVQTLNNPKVNYQGVKYDSPFNLIKGYHVCAPGLPECAGHDVCEGLIAADLMLYIKYFISEGWFSLEQLNSMICKFPYSQEDYKDRPKEIKSLEKSKLPGGAWQLYNFIRLFPLIVHGHVKTPADPVWRLVLLLKEIAQFTFAPEIHISHLASYQCSINEYLHCRRELFPNVPLRCKHHFLFHYPSLILDFGPPIKVWTLRFESKHTFFKRSWRSSNNSINILKTLSYKHEYLQSWLRCGAGEKPGIEAEHTTAFIGSLYSESMRRAVATTCSEPGSLEECKSVTIKGTCYNKGSIVVLRKVHGLGDVLEVGIIHVILLDSFMRVKFIVRVGLATSVPRYGDFKLKLSTNFQCVGQEDLLSYYPHHRYIRKTETFLCLRHALVKNDFDVSF